MSFVICLSVYVVVGHTGEPCRNGCDVVWDEPYLMWGTYGRQLMNTIEQAIIVSTGFPTTRFPANTLLYND